MKLLSKASLITLGVAVVAASLIASAQGETIFANRRYQTKVDGVFDTIMNAYDTTNGSNVTPSGFYPTGTSYAKALEGEGLAYYGGYLYVGSSATYAGDIQVFNAATGAYVKTINVSTTDTVRGMAFDSAGNLYCGLKTAGNILKVNVTSGTYSNWGSTASGISDLEIYNGKLYVGNETSGSYGVWAINLSTGGAGSQLTGTTSQRCDGIAFAADGSFFIFAETYRHRLWKAEWDATRGRIVREEPWAHVGGPIGPDGLAFAADGNLGVAVFDQGRLDVVSPDGTMYTVSNGDYYLRKWTVSAGTYSIASSINLGSTINGSKDVDYADGSLYICTNLYSAAIK